MPTIELELTPAEVFVFALVSKSVGIALAISFCIPPIEVANSIPISLLSLNLSNFLLDYRIPIAGSRSFFFIPSLYNV